MQCALFWGHKKKYSDKMLWFWFFVTLPPPKNKMNKKFGSPAKKLCFGPHKKMDPPPNFFGPPLIFFLYWTSKKKIRSTHFFLLLLLHVNGDAHRICREIQCLPYEGFFLFKACLGLTRVNPVGSVLCAMVGHYKNIFFETKKFHIFSLQIKISRL